MQRQEPVSNSPESLENKELMNKIATLENINHIMAHNLRGAASNIKLLSEILIDRKKDGIEEDADLTNDEAIQCIQKSSSSLINTLNNMMDVVNSDLNDKLRYQDCNIEEIVNNVAGQLNGVILQKKAVIDLRLEVAQVTYAQVYLENLFYNLMSNSLKYSQPGIPLTLYIATRIENGKTIIEVTDNGLGIDMALYGNRLFGLNEIFHTGYESKGVGLYITKQQIESLGGTITVKSKVNVGTQFTITL